MPYFSRKFFLNDTVLLKPESPVIFSIDKFVVSKSSQLNLILSVFSQSTKVIPVAFLKCRVNVLRVICVRLARLKPETILEGVDAVSVTHTHLDHWDDAAQATIPKNMPLFVQNTEDQKVIQSQGFKDVRVLTQATFEGIKLTKTGGQHGTDAMYRIPKLKAGLGEAMGVVFEAAGHETVYVAGDTIWRSEVDQAIQTFKPDVIVLNTGNALVTL